MNSQHSIQMVVEGKLMKVEVDRFKDGRLMVKVVFEQDSNFRKETLSWVPTFEEIDRISKTLVSIDAVNKEDEINVSNIISKFKDGERT